MSVFTMLLLLAGFVAGLIHVLSGPDHLAAIAPLAVKRPHRAWAAGLRWGFGHASGVLFVGLLSLLLRGLLPVDLISEWSDRVVGGLLIAIGLWALRSALRVHEHEHTHADGEAHRHLHMHSPAAEHNPHAHAHTHAAFGIGTLHGLAGSSHFLAILPALALGSNLLATEYLLCYGIGTVAAMMCFAQFIGAMSQRFGAGARAYRGFMFACSAVAVSVGSLWIAGFSF